MKTSYTIVSRFLAIFSLLIILNSSVKAQFITAGDIAFTGYIGGTGVESFSFVILKNIAAGTTLTFTDNGWTGTALGVSEFTCIWTASTALQAGREVCITGASGNATMTAVLAGNGTSAGTMSGNMPSFVTAGDQILAYVGTAGAPTFIAGMHMNQYSVDIAECGSTTTAGWDPIPPCTANPSSSVIPPGLTGASTALFIGVPGVGNTDFDNAKFDCSGNLSTPAMVRAALNTYTPGGDWIGQSNTPTFTLPCNCSFLGLAPLPVRLESFTGKLNPDKTVTLQWKVSEQQDIKEYVVEKSADGSTFIHLGVLPARAAAADTYSFIDMQVASGKNYYRLAIIELSGNILYSNTVMIDMKGGSGLMIYPNPVKDLVTIVAGNNLLNKNAVLTDIQGKILQTIRISSLSFTINISRYPAGVYLLKTNNGNPVKIIKE